MKRNIVVISIAVMLLLFAMFIVTRFSQVRSVDMNAFVFTSDRLVKNLKNDDYNKKELDYVGVDVGDYIYKNSLAYYVGEDKKVMIDLDFPIVSKDSDELLIMTDNAKYIDDKFHKTDSYSNSFFANGNLYNGTSFDRVDDNKYLFVAFKNNLFSLLTPIIFKNVVVPVNAIMYFDRDCIRYYSIESEQFIFHEITGIDKNDKFIIGEREITYQELLEKINLDILRDKEELKNVNVDDVVEEDYEVGGKPSTNDESNTGKTDVDIVEIDNDPTKPKVTFEQEEPTAYTFKGTLKINDIENRITRGVTFEFKYNGKLFLRKVFYNNGHIEVVGLLPNNTYEVTAYFYYLNTNQKEVKKKCYIGTVTMGNVDNVGILNFDVQDIETFSNSFKINELSLLNNREDEILKGVKKIVFNYAGKDYQLSSDVVKKLQNLLKCSYASLSSLTSNTDYTVTIKAYDLADNELPTANNTFDIRTSKEKPFTLIKTENVGVDRVRLNVIWQNKDNINVINKKYVIYDNNNAIIDGELPDSNIIDVNGLDTNKVYNIEIFGDYDLSDGKGIVYEGQLGESRFITNNLSSLGYSKIRFDEQEITDNSALYDIYLDLESTNSQLKDIITNFQIKVIDDDTKKTVYQTFIQDDELDDLRSSIKVTRNITGLYSNTKYNIEVITNIVLADSRYEVPTIKNIESFITFKKAARVDIINRYVNENTIDFDVRIYDVDHAIMSDDVFMEVRNGTGSLIYFDYLNINSDYKRIILDKLDKDEKYTFTYTVEEYNIGFYNDSFENWKVLSKEVIKTEAGIVGKIELDSLLNQITNVNLFNLSNNSRWKFTGNGVHYYSINTLEYALKLGVKNGRKMFSYYLPENKNSDVTISFTARYSSNENNAPVYICNGDSEENKILLEGLSTTYKKYTYTFHLSNEYISFIIDEILGENNITYVEFKNLQIEDGRQATSYKPYMSKSSLRATYVVDINDTRGEISDRNFYIRIYNADEEEAVKKYPMDDPNGVVNFLTYYDVMPNTTYVMYLSIKMNDRYYDLDTLVFDSNTEIRTIKTPEDFFAIHTNGNYLVAKDLDFRNMWSRYTMADDFEFDGTIDFQGYKVYRNNCALYSLIPLLGETAIIKNLDLHFYLDETRTTSWWNGFSTTSYGTLKNIKITIESSIPVSHMKMSLLVGENNGTIENFVINAKAPYTVMYDSGILARVHNGIIKNGYAYGEPINANFSSSDTSRTDKKIGVLSSESNGSAAISNVFNLIAIDVPSNGGYKEQYVGSLVGFVSRLNVRNVYTYAGGKNRLTSRDPIIGNTTNNLTAKNVYYFGDDIYESTNYSQKISKLALYEDAFQSNTLNSSNAFEIKDLIKYGYYPHVIWPESMPNQEYIALPKVENDDLIDVIAISDVEYNGAKTIVKMIVNNPNLEMVTDIGIYLIDSVRIIKQENVKGRSYLTVELMDPLKYASSYYIKSITTIGSGGDFTVNYENGERVINVDMYRPIYNVNDYLKIVDHPNENFIVMNDLDLSQVPNPQIGIFSGKINGNNHTIKNINIASSGMKSFIEKLDGGIIINLFIENYDKDNIDGNNYAGVIGQANNAYIDNVHVKNIRLPLLQYTGGIVGFMSNSIISNSSVTNFSLVHIDSQKTNDVRVGGLIGEISSSDILNCYTQEINLDVSKAIFSYSVGGIVGNNDSGKISSTYSEGRINVSYQEVGGIAGHNMGSIENVYSKVDIVSKQDFVGGIAGWTNNSNIKHTLYVGDLYSNKEIDASSKTAHFNRILGSGPINSETFAWESQHINGVVSGINNGETLLSTNDLKMHLVYETIIKLGQEFDYSEVKKGYLPKLYNSNTDELLPNQKNLTFEKSGLEIKEIRVTQSSNRIEQLTVVIYNPNNLEITGLVIEDMLINEIQGIYKDGDYTDITLVATPLKYYDSYLISGINYKNENGKDKIYSVYAKIDAIFYETIANADEWNTKIDKDSFENYIITNDIDFTNVPITNVNIKANRILGLGDGKKLKGIRYTFSNGNAGIIDTIVSQFDNIHIDDAIINNNGWEKPFGFIKYLNGTIKNVQITNVEIHSQRALYVGFIGQSRIQDFRNIYMENVKVYGRSHTGAFIGSAPEMYDGSYVEMHNILVDATPPSGITSTSYIGGFCGNCYAKDPTRWYHFIADDITVIGNNGTYIGGLFGSGDADYLEASNIQVTSTGQNVGGISGYSLHASNVKLTDSYVYGNNKNVGGVVGYGYRLANIYIDNVNVVTDNSASCVGLAFGSSGTGAATNIGIKNSSINSNSNYVGGAYGCVTATELRNIYIENTDVKGINYVGGIFGSLDKNDILLDYFTVNPNIVATGTNAGGVTGYVANQNTSSGVYRRIIRNGLIESSTISSHRLAGGLFGAVDKLIFPGQMKNIYVDADVTTVESSAGAVIGNGDSYANYDINGYGINGLRVYGESTIKKSDITTKVSDGIPGLDTNFIVTLNDIRMVETFNDIDINNDYFDLTELSNDYYPKLKNSLFPDVPFIDNYPDFIAFNSKKVVNSSGRSFARLPSVIAYTSDVDKINIEFSSISFGTTFAIFDHKYQVSQRVYTFTYDFLTDFDVVVSNGNSSKMYSFKAEDLRNNVYLNDNNYYIIDDGIIETDNNSLRQMLNNGGNYQVRKLSNTSKISQKIENAINIYNDKVLLNDNQVYDLNSKNIVATNNEKFVLVDTIPLYRFTYANSTIETYYNFSKIDDLILPKQIYVKDNMMEIIDSSLNNKKNQIIIDEYNGKSSILYLGNDKKLHNMKSPVKYPENFINQKIKEISSNVLYDTTAILVLYENGNYVLFDYKTGEIIKEKKDYKDSISDYIKSYLSGEYEKGIKKDEKYDDANKMINKLYDKSSINALYILNKSNSSYYTSVYNPVNEDYDIIELPLKDSSAESLNKLLNNDTINGQINNNSILSAYYNTNSRKISLGIFVIIVVVITMIISLVLALKYSLSNKNLKEKNI